MTDTPRPTAESPATEAGRAWLRFLWDDTAIRGAYSYPEIVNRVLAIEAEAAALSDSALREALAEIMETTQYAVFDTLDEARRFREADNKARALLAQPTPDEKPSLDAEGKP